MGLSMKMALIALVMVISRGADGADGADEGSCLSALAPCASYLNTTSKPPDACCTPLIQVINTQKQCLCNVYNSNLFKQAGITLDQALKLPALCGKNVSADACTKGNVTTSAPATSASTKPASPSAETTSGSGSGIDSFKIVLPLLAFAFLGVFR